VPWQAGVGVRGDVCLVCGCRCSGRVGLRQACSVADPGAWERLTASQQEAVLEVLSRDTPAEAAHYTTSAEAASEAEALSSAIEADAPEAGNLALQAGKGAAQMGARFIPGLAELAPIGLTIVGGLSAGYLIGDVANRFLLHIGGYGLDHTPDPGFWAITAYYVSFHEGGPIYSPPLRRTSRLASTSGTTGTAVGRLGRIAHPRSGTLRQRHPAERNTITPQTGT
jgi:hypothetical protein